jgi:transcriptional regulator GlxA family with amidase domain
VLGFSSAYLTDLVRRETGRPAMAWVRELRMQRAELLLNDTDLPVERIAHAVGYEGVRSFRRSFTATRGLAPDHWRRGRTPARRPLANGDALIVRDRNGFRSGPPPDVEIERTVPSA